MKPTTAAALGLAALLATAALPSAFCQEAPAEGSPTEAPEIDPAQDFSVNPFLRGDQTIAIGAGLHIPLFIAPGDTATGDRTNLSLGGDFSFSYQYFVARGLAIGGSIAGAFNGTVGGLSLFTAPLAFTTAYWWSIAPFEFDVGGGLGGYMMRHDGDGMLGLFAKLGGGAYWRSASAWSVGLQTYFWLVPELHGGSYSEYNRTGGFLEVSVSALYHL